MAALRKAGKRILLVTNSHSKGVALKMQRTELEPQLDLIVCSHSLGVPKENPEFWHSLQSVEKYEAKHTLLIDDSLPVLRSAQQYGIGQLLAVARPDLQQAPRYITEFPCIQSFEQILPG